ncbi:F-box family protein [Striga asiatica]|uniref:F-box family protein n=1 Tax=Striga asiatica TaxID=4170 RepID=A0A5A7PZU1_STRAF|nr:F-box family protein [Striga asiatica]
MADSEKLPLLMTTHGRLSHRQSFYSLVDGRWKTTQLAILDCKRILGSSHGWLVLVDYVSGESCLWNPVSMREISLPYLDDSLFYDRCVLTGPPTEPDCHIIFCSDDTAKRTVFRVKDGSIVGLPPGEAGGGVELMALASFQGEMYGVVDPVNGGGYEFVTVHVVNGGVEFRPLLDELGRTLKVPMARIKCVTWHENRLIEAPDGGGFLLVMKLFRGYPLDDGVEFKVFRVEVGATRVGCVELDSVDEWTIFLNYWGDGFCRISERRVCRPNSIYFTNEKGRAVKVYDLGEKSTTTFLPFRGAGRYMSVSCWVDLPNIPEPEPEPDHEPEPEPDHELELES